MIMGDVGRRRSFVSSFPWRPHHRLRFLLAPFVGRCAAYMIIEDLIGESDVAPLSLHFTFLCDGGAGSMW